MVDTKPEIFDERWVFKDSVRKTLYTGLTWGKNL